MRELSKVEVDQVSGEGMWEDIGQTTGTVFRWFADSITSLFGAGFFSLFSIFNKKS
ncbi:hypothetical protein LPH50_09250 [Xylella taiwanensis]|uniref:Uncharacterized protein n=1 Tax=Xylella taiwanensis TaxID=1444770 RepID=Z9JLU2_9GAMM|nr:hypothetical protein [Xylella taiwanensis]EWS78732.1 hypothetical protein AF72_03965 [Xylella taiwanensis]MCD8456129.1 hypothetical protein [Xylella taiwanensis]MCD8458534.1 hypothetical protein [Xylella taiwanensis]MCD8460669.1 hypothetical protein [Xylella taiwanensis]MCD8463269.1 hypothetical protein [Xylella taiwanensis]